MYATIDMTANKVIDISDTGTEEDALVQALGGAGSTRRPAGQICVMEIDPDCACDVQAWVEDPEASDMRPHFMIGALHFCRSYIDAIMTNAV